MINIAWSNLSIDSETAKCVGFLLKAMHINTNVEQQYRVEILLCSPIPNSSAGAGFGFGLTGKPGVKHPPHHRHHDPTHAPTHA